MTRWPTLCLRRRARVHFVDVGARRLRQARHRRGLPLCACTALRLARFNVCVTTVSKKFFVGLPCPAAGCAVAMFILFSSYLPSWLEARTPFLGLLITFVMALLMVSRVRYFSFKEYGFLKTHAFSSMISALLVFVLILSQPVVFGFLLGAIYLLSGPIYTYIILPRRNRQLLGSLTQN